MKINKRYFIFLSAISIIALLCGYNIVWPKKNRPNIIFITLDALRPDHLGCYDYHRETSPNIDSRIARVGVLFRQAISQSSHTAPSVTSLITSTYPNFHMVKDWGYQLSPKIETVIDILKKNGYTTALISDQVGLFSIKTLSKSFNSYIEVDSSSRYRQQNKRPNLTDQAIEWLSKNMNKSFFLWVYYVDPHGPYRLPRPYNKLFPQDDYLGAKSIPVSEDLNKESIIGKIPGYLAESGITDVGYYISQYDGEIRYIDDQIGALLDHLKKLGIDYKTTLIFTSDHGEAMGEHNTYFCHAISLYDELIRIPLIIKLSGKNSYTNREIGTQVRSIDIAPTILDILGIKKGRFMQGVSLLPLIKNRKNHLPDFSFSDFLEWKSVRTKNWKLIYNTRGKEYELYNLVNDPKELDNLVLAEVKQFEFLKEKLDNYIKQPGFENNNERETFLDKVFKQKLRSLGYME